ncbi:hypothetical protein B1813_22805 [Saccharomonospora piscinae]|uniref:Uncharacterized protein n=1 Tax=Saccharomonospora piscinae TaxID=687388 RepID=A0A1V8ZVR8_SACPI|nr:hypothetical protein [Saccharomonospora piscinae]OQO88985.1 hypothetical protein B1813_22805 [Saccharomonospora piscinae]
MNASHNSISIGVHPWLDYLLASPVTSATLVTRHKRLYLDPESKGGVAYGPLLAGLRRAVSSPDPQAELEAVVSRTEAQPGWRGPVYRECAAGFLSLLPRGATGVPVRQAAWIEDGLSVVLRGLVGLRLRLGELQLVLPYCKEPELGQEAANVVLHLMEQMRDDVLPGATPIVYDLRHKKSFKLHGRTNRTTLNVGLLGSVAQYQRQWFLAA